MGNSNRHQVSQMNVLKTMKKCQYSHIPQKHIMVYRYKKGLDYSSLQVNNIFTLSNLLDIIS